MKKLFLFLFLPIIFFSNSFSQSNLTSDESIIKNIEENGIPGKSISGHSVFSPDSVSWTSIPDAPDVFGRSIGGVIGDYIYVFGGQANSSFAAAYSISGNTWFASTAESVPAYNPSFCVANGELYKLSGSGAVSTFEKFTPDGSGTGTWTLLTSGSSNIMNTQSTMAWDGGDYIYVHSSSYTTPYTSYLSRYSISGDNWTNLTPTTLTKRYAGLQYLNGYLYLIGGLVPTGDDQTACAKYDPSTDTWSSIAPLPENVNFCKWTTTKAAGYILLVGSGGGYSSNPSNPKIFYYYPGSDSWTYDSDTPADRGLALAFFVPGMSEFFFGGGNEGGVSTNYQASCWTGMASFVPVELTSFKASVNESSVLLQWETATETNNKGFEIQRKEIINENWLNLGFVDGNGTVTKSKSYSFNDENISTGKYLYRLKQVDYDGAFSYSKQIEVDVKMPNRFNLSQNYPNPFNPSTCIQYAIGNKQYVTLKVYDILGNEVAALINEEKPAGVYKINFNAAELSSGIYFYKLTAGSFIQTKKMILLK